MPSVRFLTNHDLSDMSATCTTLADRVTALESGKAALSVTNSLAFRTASLETWRADKATARANVSTSFSVPTAVITLGLNAPTAAGINSIVNTIMGEVNGIYAILRSREIMAI